MDQDLEAITTAIRAYGSTHGIARKEIAGLLEHVVFSLSPDQYSQVIEQLANDMGVDESA